MPIPMLPMGVPANMAITYLSLPAPAWSLVGAGVYTISYWLRASRQGRSPKALMDRTLATFCLAALGGLPVSYIALDFVDHQWGWTRSWPSIPPFVAAVTGLVGHKLLTLAGERLLGWAKSEQAEEAAKTLGGNQ